jgi:allantoate deiminase
VVGRLVARLDALVRLDADRGANRPGLSRVEQCACALAATWMEEAGLDVSWDPAGNVFGRLPGAEPGLPEVWTGSHLDTVPHGGRFDGALGVVASIEALEVVRHGGPVSRTIAVVVFRDEEGWRFGTGCFGSRALCGRLENDELARRDRAGMSIAEALSELGLDPPPAAGWLSPPPCSFLEAHVEQGPRLARLKSPVGIVTSITGTATIGVTFDGRAGHAGTTPLGERADALHAAAELVLAVRELAERRADAVATVGNLEVHPGAANVVPGRASLVIDARAGGRDEFRALLADLEQRAQEIAGGQGCVATSVRHWLADPILMGDRERSVLRDAICDLGLPVVELSSRAGHDAAILAAAGVSTGMLFVRSGAEGASHVPEEATDEGAIGVAVDVLAAAIRRLAA